MSEGGKERERGGEGASTHRRRATGTSGGLLSSVERERGNSLARDRTWWCTGYTIRFIMNVDLIVLSSTYI